MNNFIKTTTETTKYIEFISDNFYIAHRYNKFSAKDVLSKHIHDTFEIVLVANGEFKYHYENTIINCNKFDLIITPPMLYHYFETTNDADYERYILLLKNPEFNKLLKITNPTKINVSKNEIIKSIFTRLDYYSEKSSDSKWQNDSETIVNLLISELLININNNETNEELERDETNSILNKIIQYINDNIEKVNTYHDVCNQFFISENYLYKLFTQNLKQTPKKYIELKKITKAEILLKEGFKPNDVAEKLGYNNYVSFYRIYVKHFKSTPTKRNFK